MKKNKLFYIFISIIIICVLGNFAYQKYLDSQMLQEDIAILKADEFINKQNEIIKILKNIKSNDDATQSMEQLKRLLDESKTLHEEMIAIPLNPEQNLLVQSKKSSELKNNKTEFIKALSNLTPLNIDEDFFTIFK